MAITAVSLLVINIGSYTLINLYWLKFAILLASLVFFILIVQFFRNPARNTALNNDHVVSPVDGKVVFVHNVKERAIFVSMLAK